MHAADNKWGFCEEIGRFFLCQRTMGTLMINSTTLLKELRNADRFTNINIINQGEEIKQNLSAALDKLITTINLPASTSSKADNAMNRSIDQNVTASASELQITWPIFNLLAMNGWLIKNKIHC